VPDALIETIRGANSNRRYLLQACQWGIWRFAHWSKVRQQIQGNSRALVNYQFTSIKFFVEESLKHYAQDNVTDEDVFETF